MTTDLSIFSSDNLSNLPMTTRWEIQKKGAEEIKEVMLAKVHEDGRAYLAQTALENAGALSALEQRLIEIDPQNMARYNHITNAYIVGAANRLARW